MKQIEIIGYKKTPTTCSIAVALTQEELSNVNVSWYATDEQTYPLEDFVSHKIGFSHICVDITAGVFRFINVKREKLWS